MKSWLREEDTTTIDEGDSILAAERRRLAMLADHNETERQRDHVANLRNLALHRQAQPAATMPVAAVSADRLPHRPPSRLTRFAYGIAVLLVAGSVLTGAFIMALVLALAVQS